jgi:hypothetical protein
MVRNEKKKGRVTLKEFPPHGESFLLSRNREVKDPKLKANEVKEIPSERIISALTVNLEPWRVSMKAPRCYENINLTLMASVAAVAATTMTSVINSY